MFVLHGAFQASLIFAGKAKAKSLPRKVLHSCRPFVQRLD
jgi:hypothetical protein